MPNMAVGQRILITAVGDYFGQTTMTTWLYRVSAVTASTDDIVFMNALDLVIQGANQLIPKFLDCVPSDGTWLGREMWYQVLGPTRFRKVIRALDNNGLFDAPTTTANVQASISRFGELGTRRHVGGIRVPIATSGSDAGNLTVDMKAALQILADEMKENVIVSTLGGTLVPQVGVPGYVGDPPVQIPVTDSFDLKETFVQSTTRVLRRRTVRVGI